MTKNAYIHIPFCKSKCNYCSFVSYPNLEFKEKYIKAVKYQINKEYAEEKLNTLYFGGGTPSLLEVKVIKNLLDLFNFEKDAEITIEVNPDSINFKYLTDLRKIGINRLSIGAQTFDDNILKLIGRRHNARQIEDAVHCACDAEFNNISLDFIYGLPNQSLTAFKKDLKKAVNLGIQHISLYGLKLEKGCYFYENNLSFPSLDIQADMYLSAVKILIDNGFEHYEISNFSLPHYNSKHNLNYWNNNYYYGFGCSASGYIDGIRYQCLSDLNQYIQSPLVKEFEQKLTQQEILEEAIFLGLRKIAGININEINRKFRIDFQTKYKKILTKYNDFFVKTNTGYAFNTKGILVSNEILSEFING